MGRKKLKLPRATPNRPPSEFNYAVALQAEAAYQVYKEKIRTEKEIARNKVIGDMLDAADSNRELWMWGLMALVLHRRYRWTASTISKILTEVQTLHNELYEKTGLEESELAERIVEMVREETGLEMVDDW